MIDTANETHCKNCGKPLTQLPGHRRREYCNDTCKQTAYRLRKEHPQHDVTIVDDSLQQRIAELEQEVQLHRHNAETAQQKLEQAHQRILKLEQQVEVQRQRLGHYYQQVHNVSTVQQQEVTPVAPPAKSRTKSAQELPEGLVNLLAFAGLHRISQNEVRSLLSSGLIHVVRGKWKTESGFVKEALDAQGRHEFWIQFHKHEEFKRCDACPHEVKLS